MTTVTLFPFYDYHSEPFMHKEMRDYFEKPPAGHYVRLSVPEYDRPCRYGTRYWKINLDDGTMTEIISNGYGIYFERTSGTGFLMGNKVVNLTETIEFGENEGFCVTFWVGIKRLDGTWKIVNSYPASSLNRFVYYKNGKLAKVLRVNPCLFTQWMLTLRETYQTPPTTASTLYFFYPIENEMVQSRVEEIDIDVQVGVKYQHLRLMTNLLLRPRSVVLIKRNGERIGVRRSHIPFEPEKPIRVR